MWQGQPNQALFWVVCHSGICPTRIRPVPLPSESAAILAKALPFPPQCACPSADGTLQTQLTLVQHRNSAMDRPGTGGELERLPGKVGGALVDQGRCKPVAWERPSIAPLLFLYCSSSPGCLFPCYPSPGFHRGAVPAARLWLGLLAFRWRIGLRSWKATAGATPVGCQPVCPRARKPFAPGPARAPASGLIVRQASQRATNRKRLCPAVSLPGPACSGRSTW